MKNEFTLYSYKSNNFPISIIPLALITIDLDNKSMKYYTLFAIIQTDTLHRYNDM